MKLHHFIIALVLLAGISSCTNELEEILPSTENQQVHMTLKDFEWDDKESRTTIKVTPEGIFYNWAKNDTVGIVPNNGTQVAFPITQGVGSNTATFSGGAWALRPSSTYAAYYPFIGDIYLDRTHVPVNFEGQCQTGSSSTAHLGKYDFMAAVAKTPDNGNVNFDFEHLSSLVELTLDFTQVNPDYLYGYLDSVILVANTPIFTTRGSVDLTAESPMIQSTAKSDRFKIDMNYLGKNTKIKVYFLMAPTQLSDQEIKVKVVRNQITYMSTLTPKDLLAGKAYKLSAAFGNPTPTQGEWIDMGLSVKWASHNLGASSPEYFGDYIAWGETSEKYSYTTDNSLTYGKYLSSISGDQQYDVATARLGAPARIPTKAEVEELKQNSLRIYTKYNRENGNLLVSKVNGNCIFIPEAGYKSDTNRYSGCQFWTATPDNYGYSAYVARIGSYFFELNLADRSSGVSIRPVSD